MKAKEILDAIQHYPGTMLKLTILSPVPSLKAHKEIVVQKQVNCFVTAGTEFANRKDVREAIESGERGEVEALPWGTWAQYPFIITHKDNEYVRLYPPSDAQLAYFNLSPSVQFYANGVPIDRQTAIVYCGSKAEEREARSNCFAVNTANIVAIG